MQQGLLQFLQGGELAFINRAKAFSFGLHFLRLLH